MFKKSERRNRRGFTLAEVLTVVAIIGILLAVAIPNVLAYYRSLKLTELDDSAKTIFMAAQSRLTAMSSAGQKLTEDASHQGNGKCTCDVDVPAGTPGSEVNFTYITYEHSDIRSLLPGGSIESQLQDGRYVVEYFPDSGVVYAVWYWEDDGDFEYSKAYTTVNPDKSDRLKNGNMVGYYGGPGFDSNVERLKLKQTPIPSLQVTNAEELLLTITVPKPSGATPLSIKATVTLSSGGIEHKIVNGVNLFDDGGSGNYTGKIALDTFKNYINRGNANFDADGMGQQFKDWVDGSTINPGDNFDIEVKVEAEETGKEYLPQRVYWRDVNSLFADVETDPATGDPVTAHIAYGRHLQNLNKDTSGVTDTITAAEQTRNIDFDATGVSDVYSWKETYKTPTEPQRKFKPIENNNLTSYNGVDHTISELVIDETGENVGLFGTTAAKLDSIRLVNAKVSGKDNVGALAGQYNGTVITNCGAYVDDVSKPAAVPDPAYDTYKVTGTGNYVGGLVGNITSTTATVEVQKSFASVKVTGATDVGGLVGQVNSNSTFTDCYSGGHTVDGTYKSDANVTGTGTTGVGGLVGAVADGNSLTLNKINYSTCSVKTSGSASETGLLVGTHTGATGTVAKGSDFERAYATGEAFDSTGAKITTGLHNETAYLDTDRGTNTVSDFITVPYDDHLKTSVYPYATHLNMHYGDWLEEASASSFCYYDVVNGTYGVWGYIVDPAGGTTTPVNTLAVGTTGPSGPYATDDGYCIPVEAGQTAPTSVTVDSKTYNVANTAVATSVALGTGGKTYDLYKVEGLFDATNGVDIDGDYYHSITVGSTNYWFNPFFACEVVQVPTTGTQTKPSDPVEKTFGGTNYKNKPVFIRTARQLANMAEQTGSKYDNGIDAQNRSYVQLLNIDFEMYSQNVKGKDSTTWEPAALITGSYDGNTFVISNLYINKTGENIGMFGNTKGTLKNIRLKNTKVSGGERVGALVGRLEGGKIENCGVYVDKGNYNDCFVRGTSRVGGLAGHVNSQNNAELKGCFAAVKVVGTSGNDGVGGLIGSYSAKDDTGVIEDCYSGGHTEGGIYTSANVSCAGKNVGGLIGKITDDAKVTLKGTVYSTCSVSGNDSDTIGLLIGGFDTGKNPTIDSSDATVYATGKAFDKDGNDLTPREEKDYLTTDLDTVKDNSITESNTHAYDDTLTGAYPYKSNLTAHYGDWVEKKKSVEACFYWAKEGSRYEVYVLGFETSGTTATPLKDAAGNDISTLCKTHHSVEEAMGTYATSNNDWGYGTIGLTDGLGTGTLPNGVTKDPSAKSDVIAALKTALAGYSFEDTDVTVYTGATEGGTVTNITSVAATGQTYHLNLGFAAAISLDNSLGSSGNPYKIRNVRQLDNIPDNNSNHYQQTHDLNGSGYTGYSGASGFTGTSGNAGTYDGQSYRILELDMTSGLFTSVTGYTDLNNIILYSPSGKATVTGSGAPAGGLIGTISNTAIGDTNIKNCVVAGYLMSTNTQQPLGGLVGEVNRSSTRDPLYITNSEAVNSLSGNRFVGGLVGQVNRGTANITNSYAGGEIPSGFYVGGIVGDAGSSNAGAVIYTNVYSYMKITSNVKYGIGPIGSTYFGARYDNCHYWRGGLPGIVQTENVVTQATLEQLKTCMGAGTGFSQSRDTVISFWAEPDSSTTTAPSPDSYPFPAVVKGYPDGTDGSTGTLQYVHYGYWPTP